MGMQPSKSRLAPIVLKRFQFSLRGMFWIVTILTILTGVEVAIWRTTVRFIEANDRRTAAEIREIHRRTAIKVRAIDEQLYEQQLTLVKALLDKHPNADVAQMQAQIEKHESESKAKFDVTMEKLGPDPEDP